MIGIDIDVRADRAEGEEAEVFVRSSTHGEPSKQRKRSPEPIGVEMTYPRFLSVMYAREYEQRNAR